MTETAPRISPALMSLAIKATMDPQMKREEAPALGKLPALRLWGDPVLEKPCFPVREFGKDARRELDEITANLRMRLASLPYGQKGYALAAPQIGESLAICYIKTTEWEGVMINPKITARKGKKRMMEGCLSIPKFFYPIERYEQVTVHWQDENGNHLQKTVKGQMAQVVQHECDHLEGRLLIEQVKVRQARRAAKRCIDACR